MSFDLVFTLYTRDQCHLCENLLAELRQYLGDKQYKVNCIDIEGEQDLQQRYAGRIPVLYLHEQFVCEYFFDKDTVDACLAKYSSVT